MKIVRDPLGTLRRPQRGRARELPASGVTDALVTRKQLAVLTGGLAVPGCTACSLLRLFGPDAAPEPAHTASTQKAAPHPGPGRWSASPRALGRRRVVTALGPAVPTCRSPH